jgi:tRNA1Val (adenine37-N6)-methyltransferase|tara:strand:- start:80 stop:835 length:756 start_codon:yes stop_codon:yes gene_type:complete
MGTSGNRKMTFKRFTVHDEKCAMKIGTDAVMLGAWANPSKPSTQLKIVDIGSGSGVIALMLAQRFEHSAVTAIELEPLAAEQSRENFTASPFVTQLSCIERSFQQWSEEVQSFEADLVVSNPPFFHNKPRSPFYARNLARHDDALPIFELCNGVAKILSKDGVFGIVWPVEREAELISAANDFNLKLIRRCEILPTKKHSAVRFLSEFQFSQQISTVAICTKIVLETGEEKGRRNFTPEYNELMRNFFLDA